MRITSGVYFKLFLKSTVQWIQFDMLQTLNITLLFAINSKQLSDKYSK